MKRLSLRCATLFLFIIASAWATRSYGYTFEADGLYYDINPDGTTVTVTYDSYLSGSYAGDIVVPDSVDYNGRRLAVTAIGASAFRACSELSSVTLPAGIEQIGDFAFRDCTSLTTATLASGVKTIGNYAFDRCGALEAIHLPTSVLTIGDCAFRDCTSMATATFGEGLATIGRWAFINCRSLRTIEIPAGTAEIGASAFQECISLDSVAINLSPDTHLTVGKFAFIADNAIRTVTTNDLGLWCGIEFVDVNANPINFSHSISLAGQAISNLEIPQGVKRIEKYAFYSCSNLRRVKFPSTTAEIADSAFWHCYGLNEVTCLMRQPIEAGSVFIDYNYTTTTLNVPYGTTELYRATAPWSNFALIVELQRPKLGDINADGAIDGNDVSILLEMALAGGNITDEQLASADINTDGAIDGNDVSILLEVALAGDDDDKPIVTPPDWKSMETLKILAIGNSFALDGLKYLPELIEASDINADKVEIYLVNHGSASLQLYSELAQCDTLPASLYFEKIFGNSEIWPAESLADILSYDWDIITIQQESKSAYDYTSYQPYLDQLTSFIKATCPNKGVVLGWNLVWGVWPLNADDPGTSRWQNNAETCRQMLSDTQYFSILVPSGTAVQNARALGIDNDGHFLTRDNWHMSYGAGRYVAACAWWEAIIAPWSGVSVVGNQGIHTITSYELSSSANPCMPVTSDNNIILQLCAAKAIEKPFELSADEIAAEAAERYGISDIPSMFPSE